VKNQDHRITVRRDAAVRASAEGDVTAPIDVVWSTMADVESWPDWQPDVRSAALRGSVASGERFDWKAGGVRISSRFGDVVRPRRLSWTGRSVGLRARHVWEFSRRGAETHVATTESFEGPLTWFLRARLRRMLESTLRRSVDALAAESGRRAEGSKNGTARGR